MLYAASIEAYSEHPLGKAIVAAYRNAKPEDNACLLYTSHQIVRHQHYLIGHEHQNNIDEEENFPGAATVAHKAVRSQGCHAYLANDCLLYTSTETL